MAYVEGAVVEPDVGLDADCAYFQGGVEGDLTPVVVVGVLDDLESAPDGRGVADPGLRVKLTKPLGTMSRVKEVG